jgi:hypothetical protein
VAHESLHALAGAQRLARIVPDDEAHREAVEILEVVFLGAARAVFRRDARGGSHAHHAQVVPAR